MDTPVDRGLSNEKAQVDATLPARVGNVPGNESFFCSPAASSGRTCLNYHLPGRSPDDQLPQTLPHSFVVIELCTAAKPGRSNIQWHLHSSGTLTRQSPICQGRGHALVLPPIAHPLVTVYGPFVTGHLFWLVIPP